MTQHEQRSYVSNTKKIVKDIFLVHIQQKLIQWTDFFVRIKWLKMKFMWILCELHH